MSIEGSPAPPKIKLPRETKGRRAVFFDDPAIDQLMSFLVELTTEVSVLYDRLDTVERLLDSKGVVSRDDIEGWRPDESARQERTSRRQDYMSRVFRLRYTERR